MSESIRIHGQRLGRRPPSNAPALRLTSLLQEIPAHPNAVFRTNDFNLWDILGNDRYGDCGPVSVANALRLTSFVLTGEERYPRLWDVLDLYQRSGNPNFPTDDNGVIMQDMLSEVHKNGIAGDKAVAYAKVDVTNIEEIRAAIAIFGCLLLGVNLGMAQQDQRTWDVVENDEPWGGHAVMAADYTSAASGADIGFITWGQPMGMTDRFWSRQVEEAWVVIWPEHFLSKAFLEGIDLDALRRDYQILTGRELPVPTPPKPVPTPPKPEPDEEQLIKLLKKIYKEIGNFLKRHGL
jgi:hypothetical protein